MKLSAEDIAKTRHPRGVDCEGDPFVALARAIDARVTIVPPFAAVCPFCGAQLGGGVRVSRDEMEAAATMKPGEAWRRQI